MLAAMRITSMKVKIILFAVALIFTIMTIWYWITTKQNSDFVSRVQKEIQSDSTELVFSKLKDGNWEMVCLSSGYDGELHIKRYNKTYPPVGDAQDGAWGLIFIKSDGSYETVTGSSGDGFNFNFGCMSRETAKLVRKTGHENLWVPDNRNGS
jgi:hypothetical protein